MQDACLYFILFIGQADFAYIWLVVFVSIIHVWLCIVILVELSRILLIMCVCMCVVDILFRVVSGSVHMLIGECVVLELNNFGYTSFGFA